MWLVGNVNVENTAKESQGILGEVTIPFELPRKARGRRKIKVRYVGYHSGPYLDIIQQHTYEAVGDVAVSEYVWRSAAKEVRMKVLADGVNVMHDSTGWKHVRHIDSREINAEHPIDYLTYPATQNTDAMKHNGVVQLENNPEATRPVHRGHRQLQDITLGFVEEHVSRIEIVLAAEHTSASTVNTARYSHEPNVRMDTISIVLELV
jgi:hypothetical protein